MLYLPQRKHSLDPKANYLFIFLILLVTCSVYLFVVKKGNTFITHFFNDWSAAAFPF